MDILNKIVKAKKEELAAQKELVSFSNLEASMNDFPVYSLSQSLLKNKPGIITEFKRRSPSKPEINLDANIFEIIKAYSNNCSAGISVLTNSKFFGGSRDDLKDAASHTTLPILRKEFIIDRYQIMEAKALGASAVLLIAEILTKDQVKELSSLAQEVNLEVLLELHSSDEIFKICDSINIIGVNNRNLKTFKTDIQYSIDIYSKLPSDMLKISESGLSNTDDIVRLRNIGYDGFLIGEYFMGQSDPGLALKNMIKTIIE